MFAPLACRAMARFPHDTDLSCALLTPCSGSRERLWTPPADSRITSHRSIPIVASQGPEPPNPLVVERFQQVISQLFQQVGVQGPLGASAALPPALAG